MHNSRARRLDAVDGIDCLAPEGAFYVYPDCSGLMGKVTPAGRLIRTDIDLCDWLLEQHHVSAVPGAAFGLSPHMRISTAASIEDLDSACAKITAACATLRAA